jgi:MSHA biogenesis protein MshO
VLSSPMERLAEQRRRGELVDLANTALNRMTRDVRLAVPNSLRLSADGQAFELLAIDGAARYRPNRVGAQGLRFATSAPGSCGSTTTGGRCDSLQALQPGVNLAGVNWLVVYNVGAESGGTPVAGSNVWAYANPGVITPTGTSFAALAGAPANESEIAVSLPGGMTDFAFAFASPQRRLYFASQVLGYRCSAGQLLRYSYSQLLPAVPAAPPPGANPQPLANSVSACRFAYQPGSTQRAGLLSLTLGLSQAGESIELMQQVHVDNAP